MKAILVDDEGKWGEMEVREECKFRGYIDIAIPPSMKSIKPKQEDNPVYMSVIVNYARFYYDKELGVFKYKGKINARKT